MDNKMPTSIEAIKTEITAVTARLVALRVEKQRLQGAQLAELKTKEIPAGQNLTIKAK